jgi:hypothetical protein
MVKCGKQVERSRRVNQDARRFFETCFICFTSLTTMAAAAQLASLYQNLKRSFDARPCYLETCGALLAQLKVVPLVVCVITLTHIRIQIGLIETGLLLPQGHHNIEDLVIARMSFIFIFYSSINIP